MFGTCGVQTRTGTNWARRMTKSYYARHKTTILARQRVRYRQNRDSILARQRAYYRRHKSHILRRQVAYQKRRCKDDPAFAMLCRARARIRDALRGHAKAASTRELTGRTPTQLAAYLESQFDDGMTWENRDTWHVDHRIPCSAFDFSDPEQQRICFWYKNLQPMWGKLNLTKSDTHDANDKQALVDAYRRRIREPTLRTDPI